jgi:hypothetical protein
MTADPHPTPDSTGADPLIEEVSEALDVINYGTFNILDHNCVLHLVSVKTTFARVAARVFFGTVLLGFALAALHLWTPIPAFAVGVVAGFSAARFVRRLWRLWRLTRIEAVGTAQVRANHQWADPHLVSGVIDAVAIRGVRRCSEGDLCCIELVLHDGRCAQLVSTVTESKDGTDRLDQAVARVAGRLGVPTLEPASA